MNPDDDHNNHDDNNRDADKFHISPEYGEQGEGPGEQPVRKAEHTSTTDGFKKPVSISITEVGVEEKITSKPAGSPSEKSPFNHGEDDVMQYFTAEKHVDEKSSASAMPFSGSISSRGNTIGRAPVTTGGPTGAREGIAETSDAPAEEMMRSAGIQGINMDSPKAKKKTSLVSTIAIVLITVLVTAVVVFAILIMTQGHSKDNKVSSNGSTTTSVESKSITCTKADGTDEEKKAAGDATSINTTVIASYTGKDLDNYSVTKRYTYSDESAAAAGLNTIKNTYISKITEIISDNQDPFSSTYAQKEKEVTESHFADAPDITSESINLINIPKGSDTIPDISVVESTLKMSGYTCKVKSAE